MEKVKMIDRPSIIKAAGSKEKSIKEFFGRVNSGTQTVSIAKMESPEGWEEPGQTPEFDEYTLVLEGTLQVKCRDITFQVAKDQGILVPGGQWVQYSTPFLGGASYVAICLPAFSIETVHRDEENFK